MPSALRRRRANGLLERDDQARAPVPVLKVSAAAGGSGQCSAYASISAALLQLDRWMAGTARLALSLYRAGRRRSGAAMGGWSLSCVAAVS